MYDLFDTRTMIESLEQMKPARNFLLNTFFPTENVSPTEFIDIDVYKGKRRMAPFVNPRLEGKIIERLAFSTHTYKPPYIKIKRPTTAEKLLKRKMGETIYTGQASPEMQAAKILGEDLAEFDNMIDRREEWMAAQVLTTGKVRCIGDGVDQEIDFLMEATHLPVLAGGQKWDAPTTCTPIRNLRDWRKLISKDSGVVATDCIFGSGAYEYFLNSEDVRGSTSGRNSLFDLMRVNLGQIDPRDMGNGVNYIGRITELNLDVWTYDEWYLDEDDNETEKPMIPDNMVLLGSRNAYTKRQYAMIQDLDVGDFSVKRFPKSWTKKDPSVRYLLVQSAAVPCAHQIDAFLCATVY